MTVLEKTGEQIAEGVHKVSRATSAVAGALEDSIAMAKRVGKKGSDAAEEFMDDTTQRIKRHPIETVMMAFAAGFIAGAFVSWMARHR
jgi:ElaB/YqjD/DUF883 family membrane-anchored ribosome-binding protein